MDGRSRSSVLPFVVLLLVVLAFGFATILLLRDGGAEDGRVVAGAGDKIGYLELRGVIMESRPYIDALDKLAEDEEVAAILLRVDSPGGAVGPSQEIYEKLMRVREQKPVVISMGTVAASGGLYVASAGTRVLANPGTLTGSIGVIMQFTDLSELLQWAKVDVEVVKTGRFKDAGAAYRPLTDVEQDYFQDLAQEVLGQFLDDVAEGRAAAGVSRTTLVPIADGRVLTGAGAVDAGLVDELGGYARAISVAADLGGIEGDPEIHEPRIRPSWIRRLMEEGVDQQIMETVGRLTPLWVLWVP